MTDLVQLKQARDLLLATEQLAGQTVIELDRQRQQLIQSRKTVQATQHELGAAQRLVAKMRGWWRG